MNLNTFIWLSHKTGVTFFMRVIFLTGIRALAFCVCRRQYQNKQGLLGERLRDGE